MQNQPRSNRYPLWLNTAINRYPADSNAASLPKFSSTGAWNVMVNGLIVDARRLPRHLQEEAYRKGLIPYLPPEKDNQ